MISKNLKAVKEKHREFHHSLLSPQLFLFHLLKLKVTFFLKKKKIIIKVTLLKGPLIRKERNMVPNRLEFF